MQLRGSQVADVLLLGEDPFAAAATEGHVRHLSWFVGPADRSAIAAGYADYVPCHLSEIPDLIRTGRPEIDTALLMMAPPDRHGLLSLGATLQLGIGGVPHAVIALLEGHSDLGIHSAMISDGVMTAYENGVLSGRRKTRHRGKIVTTFALGTRSVYDWLHENTVVEAHPCDHTNDPFQAAQNERLIAINSAISVDLTGQVDSGSIGSRVYSAVGGQVDFIQAARLSKGGRAIIAMPSTARQGTVSRLVARLAEGTGVVTSRADVDTVVTKHGIAELHGKSVRERIEALVAIADARFQDELMARPQEEPYYTHR